MRCQICNDALTDVEATRLSKQTGEYLDTCNICLGEEFLILELANKQKDLVTDKLNAIQEASK
jgi:hypothetical protein